VGEACGTHGAGEKCKMFWWKDLKEIDHSEDRGVGGRMGPECILGRLAGDVCSEFTWPRVGAVGGWL
jgi:hypothetical protein